MCLCIALPRSQRRLQHHNVGPIHPRPDSRSLHDESLHHKYLGELLDDGVAGYGHLQGVRGWAVVAWGCDDGCGLYSSWDARGGVIVFC